MVRGYFTRIAGLGHQMQELVFYLTLAWKHNATFEYVPFDNETSNHGSYAWVDTYLGLARGLPVRPQRTVDSLRCVDVGELQPNACNVRADVTQMSCWTGMRDKSCFIAPELAGASEQFAPFLRRVARTHGTWANFRPAEFKSAPASVHVVWHVRIGDLYTRDASSVFYSRVAERLRSRLEAQGSNVDVLHHVIAGGKAVGDGEKRDCGAAGGSLSQCNSEDVLPAEWQDTFKNISAHCRFPRTTSQDALSYMMHADVVVGSGSSFPVVASIFSDYPLHLQHVSKLHEATYSEFVGDSLLLDEAGCIHASDTVLDARLRQLVDRASRRAAGSGGVP